MCVGKLIVSKIKCVHVCVGVCVCRGMWVGVGALEGAS